MDELKQILREKVCLRCDFYKEDEDDLECFAYKEVKRLLLEGKITPDDL